MVALPPLPVSVMGKLAVSGPLAWSVPPPKLKAAVPEPPTHGRDDEDSAVEVVGPAAAGVVAEIELPETALVPPDCVNIPAAALPTYWVLTESDPPLMPEAVSLTVRVPLPKLTVPVPESISPLLRLMEPPVAAVMAPWQLTGSLIEPQPPKPCPAGTTSVVPAVWVKPKELELLKPVDGSNPAGTISSELVPMLTTWPRGSATCPRMRSRMQLEPLSTAGCCRRRRFPELTRPPLIWSMPPLS